MDLILTKFILGIVTNAGVLFFLIITKIGDLAALAVASVFLSLWLMWRAKFLEAIIFSSGMLLAGLLTQFLKILIGRIRPFFGAVIVEDSFSFPSGHALGAMVFYGFLLFLTLRFSKQSWVKKLAKLFIPLLIGLVGFSRVYLGVHWFSDVLAGWLIGGLILAVMIKIVKYAEH